MSHIQPSLFDDQPEFRPKGKRDSNLQYIDHQLARVQVFEHTVSHEDLQYMQLFQFYRQHPLPKDGQSQHIISNGPIDLTSYVLWLSQQVKHLKRVLISAWSFGFDDTMLLRRLCVDKKIGKLDIISSDMQPKRHQSEHQHILYMRRYGLVGDYWIAPLHSKLILAETDDGRYFVVNSAANCTMKAQIEIAVTTQSRDLYDHYDRMLTDLDQFRVSESECDPNFNTLIYEKEAKHTVLYGD